MAANNRSVDADFVHSHVSLREKTPVLPDSPERQHPAAPGEPGPPGALMLSESCSSVSSFLFCFFSAGAHLEPHSHQQSHGQELQQRRIGVARAAAAGQHRAGKRTGLTRRKKNCRTKTAAELKRFCTRSLTRCRRVSFLWNNRSPHSRPTWKAWERPVRRGLRGKSLKRSLPPIQRRAMRCWSARAPPLHLRLHLLLLPMQTRTLQGRRCSFIPPSDNYINLEGRNDFCTRL